MGAWTSLWLWKKSVIDREANCHSRKIKESIHSLYDRDHINSVSYTLPDIWTPALTKQWKGDNVRMEITSTWKLRPQVNNVTYTSVKGVKCLRELQPQLNNVTCTPIKSVKCMFVTHKSEKVLFIIIKDLSKRSLTLNVSGAWHDKPHHHYSIVNTLFATNACNRESFNRKVTCIIYILPFSLIYNKRIRQVVKFAIVIIR